jgi:acylphosphatase
MEQVQQLQQRVVVSGRVQQVGYRDWVIRRAQALGVTGWIRNLTDGRVEMLATGSEDMLTRFLELSREGPMMARVDQLEAYEAAERPVKGFTKRFTA